MSSVTMPLPRMNNPAIPATVTFNYREMPALNGPGIGEVAADDGLAADSGEWSLWHNLEGTFISAPAAAAWGAQQIDLFGISTDSQLYHKRWHGAAWGLWESLEGTCIYTPAAVARGANLIDVFAIGLDKHVYHKWWDGATWQGWEDVGGTCIHGLAATSWGPDRIDLFSVGTNSCLYHNCWDGEAWQGWRPFLLQDHMAWERSSTTIAAPAAVASAPGRIDVFVLGINNQLYHAWGDGETWQGWENVGGPGMHGVAVTARGPRSLDLFTIGTDIEGTDNHMYHRAMVNGKWGNWDSLGGACISAPAAVALGENRLEAFVVGTRSALFQKTWNGSGEGDGLGVQEYGQQEKDAAKQKLDNSIQSRLFAQYKARAKALIDDPTCLAQGSYSICGLSTVVYFLLQYDLDKYVALVKSIFDGADFNGIPVGMKNIPGSSDTYSVLLYGREEQIRALRSRGATYRPDYRQELDFDFIVSRSLGKLLKIKLPKTYESVIKYALKFDSLFNYKEMDDNMIELFGIDLAASELTDATGKLNKGTLPANLTQDINTKLRLKAGYGIDFGKPRAIESDGQNKWKLKFRDTEDEQRALSIRVNRNTLAFSIDINNDYHLLRSDGDLPFNFYDIQHLMREIIGASTVAFDHDDIDQINATFDGDKPFVIAMVNGAKELSNASDDTNLRTFDRAPMKDDKQAGPLFEHFIAITDRITEAGAYYKVPVWTWEKKFDVRIKKEFMSDYLFGYAYGQL